LRRADCAHDIMRIIALAALFALITACD